MMKTEILVIDGADGLTPDMVRQKGKKIWRNGVFVGRVGEDQPEVDSTNTVCFEEDCNDLDVR